jgi:eukaryotic-like serine/threonine-protein kinase
MTLLDLTLEPGTVLAGKYRVERVIGRGGMGVVAAAYHLQLEQRVALKLMLPHAVVSGEAVARFLREARAAARISSEHVARVFDVGALETGEPYIAMEYLEGSDIAELLVQRGRLPAEEAVDYLLQACEALAEAHAAGIVHRDRKPGNLFLVRRLDGRRFVKILDFGISKMSGGPAQSNAPATRTSALMGSPLYMSPEQMGSSKHVDARSDVWALGVVLYELVSGTPPFNGETLPQVCARVMSEPAPPLTELAPGLPPALYYAVHRCIEKEPAQRFQSVAELAHALEPLASPSARQSIERIAHILGVARPAPEAPSPQEPQGAAAVTGSGPMGTQAAWGETSPPPGRRRAAPRVAAGALAVLALGAAGYVFALRPSTDVAGLLPSALPPPSAVAAPVAAAEPVPSPAVEAAKGPTATATPSASPENAQAAALASAAAGVPAGRAPSRPARPKDATKPAEPKPAPPASVAAPAPAQPPAPTSTRSRL